MSSVVSAIRGSRAPHAPSPAFTVDRLQEAIRAARLRAIDGPLEEIWVDIFEAEHLLNYRAGILSSVERLTQALENYSRFGRC
jgi:hypothetical protein